MWNLKTTRKKRKGGRTQEGKKINTRKEEKNKNKKKMEVSMTTWRGMRQGWSRWQRKRMREEAKQREEKHLLSLIIFKKIKLLVLNRCFWKETMLFNKQVI